MFAPVTPAVGHREGTRVVLGIDPGLTRCGYAAVAFGAGRERLSAFGVLTTPRTDDVAQRLARLHADFVELLAGTDQAVLQVGRIVDVFGGIRPTIRSLILTTSSSPS